MTALMQQTAHPSNVCDICGGDSRTTIAIVSHDPDAGHEGARACGVCAVRIASRSPSLVDYDSESTA